MMFPYSKPVHGFEIDRHAGVHVPCAPGLSASASGLEDGHLPIRPVADRCPWAFKAYRGILAVSLLVAMSGPAIALELAARPGPGPRGRPASMIHACFMRLRLPRAAGPMTKA